MRPLKEIAETGTPVARLSAKNSIVINMLFVSQREYDALREPVIINAMQEGNRF